MKRLVTTAALAIMVSTSAQAQLTQVTPNVATGGYQVLTPGQPPIQIIPNAVTQGYDVYQPGQPGLTAITPNAATGGYDVYSPPGAPTLELPGGGD